MICRLSTILLVVPEFFNPQYVWLPEGNHPEKPVSWPWNWIWWRVSQCFARNFFNGQEFQVFELFVSLSCIFLGFPMSIFLAFWSLSKKERASRANLGRYKALPWTPARFRFDLAGAGRNFSKLFQLDGPWMVSIDDYSMWFFLGVVLILCNFVVTIGSFFRLIINVYLRCSVARYEGVFMLYTHRYIYIYTYIYIYIYIYTHIYIYI